MPQKELHFTIGRLLNLYFCLIPSFLSRTHSPRPATRRTGPCRKRSAFPATRASARRRCCWCAKRAAGTRCYASRSFSTGASSAPSTTGRTISRCRRSSRRSPSYLRYVTVHGVRPCFRHQSIACHSVCLEYYIPFYPSLFLFCSLLQAEDGTKTKQWYAQLQYHSQGMGTWRKRRNALANIMINGMMTRT